MQSLLEERTRILAELESVERLLRSRYNWQCEDLPAQGIKRETSVREGEAPQAQGPATRRRKLSREGQINYSSELEAWVQNAPEIFTVLDFREFLRKKFGEEKVNSASLNGPLKRLTKEERVVEVQKGTGRLPTKYKLKTQ